MSPLAIRFFVATYPGSEIPGIEPHPSQSGECEDGNIRLCGTQFHWRPALDYVGSPIYAEDPGGDAQALIEFDNARTI